VVDEHADADNDQLARLRQRLTVGLRTGQAVVFGDDPPPAPPADGNGAGGGDPVVAAARTVPATLLRGILADRDLHQTSDPRGLTVRGALIDGALDLDHLTCLYPLALTRCTLTNHVHAEQAHLHSLRVTATRIQGTDADGNAVAADDLTVDGGVFLDEVFTTAGAIRLIDAHIAGDLSLRGARLIGTDGDGDALVADRLKVDGGVFLDGGFTAAGGVRLLGAHIAAELSLRGAQLTGTDSDGDALVASGLQADSAVFLDDGFEAAGAVRLLGAHIAGQLSLRGAQLTGTDSDGNALVAPDLQAHSDVYLDHGFKAVGAVRLVGAHIAGQLSMRSARLTGADKGGRAVFADRLHVDGIVFLDGGFEAAGAISLASATLGNLHVGEGQELPQLGDATGWQLRDVRGAIRNDSTAARDWLDQPHRFVAQPWEELAAVYDRNGQPADARRMRYWSAVRSTRHGPWWSKPGRWLYRVTTGHGYYPLIALVWLAVVFAAAYGITTARHEEFTTATTAIIRDDPDVRTAAIAAGIGPGHPLPGRVKAAWCSPAWDTPCLNDLAYSFTVALPATAAGQTQAWQPPGTTVAGVQTATWLQILRTLAWVFTALLLAGVTGLLHKQT
jgi:hypothetical protein